MNRRSVSARYALGLLVTLLTVLGVSGCRAPLYYYTQNQFAGRAIPPSGLQQRVLATYTATGTSGGGAEILDGLRDLRSNIQNTHPAYFVTGFSGGYPGYIINFPEQQYGYVLDQTTGAVTGVNYATETGTGAVLTLGANASSAAVSPDGSRAVGSTTTQNPTAQTANSANQVIVRGSGAQAGPYYLNLPNVNRVMMNPGNSVILATTRNSNALYRIIQLPQADTTTVVPGAVDCEPLLLPVYCIVPVKGTFDRPTNAYFSVDGSTAYILNCGPECGGTTASVTALEVSQLTYNNIPTVNPLDASAPPSMTALPVANPIPIPGGVTTALSDGTSLYLAGQSLFRATPGGALTTTPAADGLFTGFLTVLPLSSYVPQNPVAISDGTHNRLLFADDDTLWAGATNCAVGERAHTGANINCLTMVKLGATPTATVVPAVTPGGSTTVAYPNTNGNLYYYGDLTGICWVQNYHKVYTAYGGQIHIFSTADGSEINNGNVTVQGIVLDVAYMDALTNTAN